MRSDPRPPPRTPRRPARWPTRENATIAITSSITPMDDQQPHHRHGQPVGVPEGDGGAVLCGTPTAGTSTERGSRADELTPGLGPSLVGPGKAEDGRARHGPVPDAEEVLAVAQDVALARMAEPKGALPHRPRGAARTGVRVSAGCPRSFWQYGHRVTWSSICSAQYGHVFMEGSDTGDRLAVPALRLAPARLLPLVDLANHQERQHGRGRVGDVCPDAPGDAVERSGRGCTGTSAGPGPASGRPRNDGQDPAHEPNGPPETEDRREPTATSNQPGRSRGRSRATALAWSGTASTTRPRG